MLYWVSKNVADGPLTTFLGPFDIFEQAEVAGKNVLMESRKWPSATWTKDTYLIFVEGGIASLFRKDGKIMSLESLCQ